MSAEGSEDPVPATETDNEPTKIAYGDGGVPVYIGVIWVVFIVTYFVVMATVALPDLIAWIRA